ncbi:hypothetical protein PY479_03525 [Shewanella sp. A32]|uniref:hypothetical protein n=1 Tax=Shewanella sp. A32 TaxID=3031327 RepID=UPI0023B94CB1|nr:hypothetical protein [Shewanella sp. A32]MDF0533348.1 hypothetical protein [Shewanella sp. A32]
MAAFVSTCRKVFTRQQLFPALQHFMEQHPQLTLESSGTDRKVDIVVKAWMR